MRSYVRGQIIIACVRKHARLRKNSLTSWCEWVSSVKRTWSIAVTLYIQCDTRIIFISWYSDRPGWNNLDDEYPERIVRDFFQDYYVTNNSELSETAITSSLFLGKVQWFGSYQQRLRYRRFYISPGDFFLRCRLPSRIRFTFVILHRRLSIRDAQIRSSTYITNSRQLFMLDFSFSLYISFHITCYHAHQEEISSV